MPRNPPNNFTAMIFDLDNTLIEIPNTWAYFDQIIQDVMDQEYHLPIPPKSKRDTLWRSGKEYVQILKSWDVKDPSDFWCRFDQIDGKKRKKLIEQRQLILFEDVIPSLEELSNRRIKLAVLTNSPQFIAEHELDEYGLAEFFSIIRGLGEDQAICKPEPDGIHEILTAWNVKPREVCMVGDSGIDLLAAQRALVWPVQIDRSMTKHISAEIVEQLLDHYTKIPNLKDLISFI